MKYLITIVLLVFTLSSFSQNLVPNPSFEYYSACPDMLGQINVVSSWINPTQAGSPDYYNRCSSSSIVSIPLQTVGQYTSFQNPHSGNAYVAIVTYGTNVQNEREYIQTTLMSSLINGSCYYVNFYINEVDCSGLACNNIGIYFSTNAVNNSGSALLLNYPAQIKKFNNPIIKDTLNWVLVSGIYTANGGEQYITIGNFDTDQTTDTITYNSFALNKSEPYYYIDDVSVIPVDSLNMPAYAGHDTSIILGDSVFIGQEITNLNCNWYANGNLIASDISGLYVKPTESTTYIVEQNLCGTITYDTVLIKVNHAGIVENYAMANLFRVYPNPSNGLIYIVPQGVNCDNVQVSISNLTGKTVYNSSLTVKDGVCNFNLKIEPGIYFIKITVCSSEEKIIKKLIIQ